MDSYTKKLIKEAVILWKGFRNIKYRENGKIYKFSYLIFKLRGYKEY